MDATSAKVRTQKLRDFTVQIRDARMDQIVGTGIAVSMDGQIVTCAHVVEAALGVHPRHANGAEVGVYFPQTRGGEDKSRRATVATCFRQHDDDVVLLQLVGSPVPLGPEQIAVLGTAEQLWLLFPGSLSCRIRQGDDHRLCRMPRRTEFAG